MSSASRTFPASPHDFLLLSQNCTYSLIGLLEASYASSYAVRWVPQYHHYGKSAPDMY